MTDTSSVVLHPGAGRTIAVLGSTITFKVASSETDDALWVMEHTVPPEYGGPPPHRHHQTHEVFYILVGTFTFCLDDQTMEAPPGAVVWVAPGTMHTFSNPTTEPATYLQIGTPGGFEGYFDELPELVAEHGFPLPPEVLRRLGERYDMDVVGPPPG